jgi:hypothetical protein
MTYQLTHCCTAYIGEIATANWLLSHWDTISENWLLKWSELKKNDQKYLSIFADSVYYEICVVACLLLLGGGYTSYHGPIDNNTLWMMPTLHARIQLYSSKELPADPSAKCLRVGSVNEVVKRCNNLLHKIIRGNWQMKYLNTVFEYLIQTFQTLNEGGRAIAGYKDQIIIPQILVAL